MSDMKSTSLGLLSLLRLATPHVPSISPQRNTEQSPLGSDLANLLRKHPLRKSVLRAAEIQFPASK